MAAEPYGTFPIPGSKRVAERGASEIIGLAWLRLTVRADRHRNRSTPAFRDFAPGSPVFKTPIPAPGVFETPLPAAGISEPLSPWRGISEPPSLFRA